MPFTLDFVDSIVASPAVRLPLVGDKPWRTLDGTDFGVAPLNRALSRTLLTDGSLVTAAAYDNRMLRLVLRVEDPNPDAFAAAVQRLSWELDRPANFLRYQPDTSQPVFFRTLRSDFTSISADSLERTVTAAVLAEPFGYGLEQTSLVTLWADPAEGATLNSNWDFETTATPWTATGGTAVRSTAQSHDGVASLLLTPDGVTANSRAISENVAATATLSYRLSAWLRCAVTRSVNLQAIFFDGVGTSLGTTTQAVSLTAATWAPVDLIVTAPANTATVVLRVEMTGTPPAGNTLHIDRARIRVVNSLGGPAFDLTSVLGDVETPLVIAMTANAVTTAADRNVVFATRRRGTPSAAPVVLQAESGGLGTDTTTQPNTVGASGNNFTRTTFATDATMRNRLSWAPYPSAVSLDARGEYRGLLRCRQTVAGDVIKVRLGWGGVSLDTANVVQSGNWFWIDLGLISVPRGADPVYDGFSGVELAAAGTNLDVSAQRVSGTGGLDMDVLLLVPADDQWSTVFMPSNSSGLSVFDSVARQAYRLDESGAVAPITGDVYSIPGGGSAIYASPGVTNRVYVVQGLAGADAGMTAPSTDIFTPLTVSYWPRYLSVAAP